MSNLPSCTVVSLIRPIERFDGAPNRPDVAGKGVGKKYIRCMVLVETFQYREVVFRGLSLAIKEYVSTKKQIVFSL